MNGICASLAAIVGGQLRLARAPKSVLVLCRLGVEVDGNIQGKSVRSLSRLRRELHRACCNFFFNKKEMAHFGGGEFCPAENRGERSGGR